MSLNYLHGIETVELDSPAGPVSTVKSNVIGLVGTAPDADPSIFPLNTPVAVFSDALKAGSLKTNGTLLDGVDAIYSQKASVIVVTRVAEGKNEAETWANAVGSPTGKLGVWSLLKSRPILKVAPKIMVAPGLTSGRPTNGITAAAVVGNGGSGYAQATTSIVVDAPAAGGIQATAEPQIVGGVLTGVKITNPGAGYTGTPKATVVGAGTGATVELSLGKVANPVGVSFGALAKRMRAVAYIDGPGTSYEDAVSFRNDFGNQRVMVIDPGVLKYDTASAGYVNRPASAYAAGIQARIDQEKGFWYPFSNNEILDIGGPSRPVDWEMGDPDCEANMLNAAQVTTIIHEDGFRFWGLRGTDASDPLWAQMAVRRTADMVYESLEKAHRDRLDKPFSYQLLTGIQGSVNSYLRTLRTRGALIGGQCWIDPAINTPTTFAAGELTTDFDLEPPASLEHMTFRAVRNPAYYTDFIETFTRLVTSA